MATTGVLPPHHNNFVGNRLNRIFICTFTIAAVFMIIVISLKYNYTTDYSFIPYQVKPRAFKRILVYTPFFGEKPWWFVKSVPNYVDTCGCKVSGECEITYDHQLLNKSDIVLFHARDMPDVRPIHSKRPKNQLWMHFIWENPYYTPTVYPLDPYFNLTSSYRLDSDLPWLYSFTKKHRKYAIPRNITLPNFAKGKTRFMAWRVSNCVNKRDQLARLLTNYGIQIDTYGRCNYKFTNHSKGEPPYHLYKFYFAAENQLCRNYITEKYWKCVNETNNMIPVVFGGSNYSNPRLVIPGSYIDAMKFSSPKKLAEYLLLLDKNDTLYNEYFAWKKKWTIGEEPTVPPRPKECNEFMCDLCKKLHDNDWNFRSKPLINSINAKIECKASETFFYKWIKRK